MKKLLAILFSLALIFPGLLIAQTIGTLDQFTSTTTPSSAITQRTYGKALKITGVTTGTCLSLDANSLLTTITCGSGGGGSAFPFTPQTWGVSTTTLLGLFNGFISNASSTINANLFINGNSTTTSATTTNFFSTTASTTNFFGQLINGFGLSTCTGTNALTWTGGSFTCTAQPQGVLTSLNGLTAAAQTFATTSSNGGWGFSSNTSTHTLNIPTASATNVLGLLSNTDWSTFNSKGSGTVTSVTGTYPIQSTGGATPVISLAFGTTTNNLWSGTNIWQNASSTFVNSVTIGGNATVTNATTTGLFVSGDASTTNFFGSGLSTCNTAGSSALIYTGSSGRFGCNTISGGSVAGSNGQLQFNDNSAFAGAAGSFYDKNYGAMGWGTTTPKWLEQLASSTAPQLALSDGTLTSNHWTLRSIGNNLYFSTSSPSTFASSSQSTTNPPLAFTPGGLSGFMGVGLSNPVTVLDVATGTPSASFGSLHFGREALNAGSANGTLIAANLPVGATNNLIELQIGNTIGLRVTSSGNITSNGGITLSNGGVVVAGASGYTMQSRGALTGPSDGVMGVSNNAGTGFSRFFFGGNTNAFPSLVRSGTNLAVVLGDGTVGAGSFAIGTTTATAVFQATTGTANATTSIQFGKANQNKGTCMTYYDTAGTPVYAYIPAGTTAFTLTSTIPSGCTN